MSDNGSNDSTNLSYLSYNDQFVAAERVTATSEGADPVDTKVVRQREPASQVPFSSSCVAAHRKPVLDLSDIAVADAAQQVVRRSASSDESEATVLGVAARRGIPESPPDTHYPSAQRKQPETERELELLEQSGVIRETIRTGRRPASGDPPVGMLGAAKRPEMSERSTVESSEPQKQQLHVDDASQSVSDILSVDVRRGEPQEVMSATALAAN